MWSAAREIFPDEPNVYFDTSSTYGFGGLKEVRLSYDALKKDHIFFGCDFPMWTHSDEIRMLRALDLPRKETDGLLGENFLRFYEQYDVK